MLRDWFARFERGDRLALSRLLTWIGRGEYHEEIEGFLAGLPKNTARVAAFTGSGGVGKSTLVGKMIDKARSAGEKAAVLACDPQSPLSGGALLGDRFRMGEPRDEGVFIRSLAAESGKGALAEHLDLMILALERFGFDNIFLETVGAGQGDTGVRDLADVVVLMLQPEAGDELQWEKAGVFEVADVIVVHKADLPGAEQTVAQVRASLELTHANVPVIAVSSKRGLGHEELWQCIRESPREDRASHTLDMLARRVAAVVGRKVHGLARHADEETRTLASAWKEHRMTTDEAARQVLSHLVSDSVWDRDRTTGRNESPLSLGAPGERG